MKTILIIPATSVENERVFSIMNKIIGLLQNFYHSMFIITSKVDEHLRRSVSVWYSNSHSRSRDHEEKVESCFVISFGTDSSWSKQLLNSFKNLILCLN